MRSLLVSPAHSVFGSPTPIFINKLGIQSLAVVTPTSKEGNSQNAMPPLVYPTRPRTCNACKRKKYRLACQSTHCYLIAIGNPLTIIIYKKMLFGESFQRILVGAHSGLVDRYSIWWVIDWIASLSVREAVIEKVPPLAKSGPGGPAKPVTGS